MIPRHETPAHSTDLRIDVFDDWSVPEEAMTAPTTICAATAVPGPESLRSPMNRATRRRTEDAEAVA